MGIGPVALTLYTDLARRGLMHAGQRVLELGSQKLYLRGWDHCVPLFAAAMKCELPPQRNLVSSCDLMEMLGFQYTSVDPDGMYGALKCDLNVYQSLLGSYDIVTNHGDSEHIFNQDAFFRTMHNSTALGGLMIHVVPMRGYVGHCYYLYKPELFETMAETNNYSVVGIWTSMNETTTLRAWDTDRGERAEPGSCDILLTAVLRKTVEAEFVTPNQRQYQQHLDAI